MDKGRSVVLFLLCKRCGREEEGREVGEGGGGELKENTRPEPRVGNTTHLAAIKREYSRAPRLKHAGEHSIYKK
jgi:hypothetical protein